jgi:predicted nucleic acid-binding protein
MLDAGPLGMLVHPHPNREFAEWYSAQRDAGVAFIIPEIADFELRRELIRAGLGASVRRLDGLIDSLAFWPLNTPAMRRAAELWAIARNRGRPTADPRELDCDVILAAQAEQAGAEVITENTGHLGLFVPVRHWKAPRG